MTRFHNRFAHLALALALVLAVSTQAFAQYSKYSRDNPAVRGAFSEIVAAATESTVLVFSKGKQVAVGAVVDKEGHVLTKASELDDDVECIFRGGERMKAQLVGVAERDDLALLKVKAPPTRSFKAIDWATDIPPVGSWLATVGVEKRPVAIGVMSVPTRKPRFDFRWNRGFLGVSVGGRNGPATIVRVSPGSPAARAKVKVDDIVMQVNEKKVGNSDEMIALLKQRKAGEEVRLLITRDKKELKIAIKLGWFGGFNQEQNTLGGPLSGRRYGFQAVFQHDTYLRPEHCGGPLINTDGKAVGVNIARVGRVSSQAIPVKTIRKVLPDLLAGKLAPKLVSKKDEKKADEKKVSTKKPEDKKTSTPKNGAKKAEKKSTPKPKKSTPKPKKSAKGKKSDNKK